MILGADWSRESQSEDAVFHDFAQRVRKFADDP